MDKNDKVQTVNPVTGEKKEGYFVYIAYPKPKIKDVRWMMTFQDSLKIIAKDTEITGQVMRVYMFAISELEFENYLTIKQTVIAQELAMDKSVVSRAIKLLVDKGIILKVKEGRVTAYKLNPEYGWKGKVSTMETEKKRIARQTIVDFEKYSQAKKATQEESINE